MKIQLDVAAGELDLVKKDHPYAESSPDIHAYVVPYSDGLWAEKQLRGRTQITLSGNVDQRESPVLVFKLYAHVRIRSGTIGKKSVGTASIALSALAKAGEHTVEIRDHTERPVHVVGTIAISSARITDGWDVGGAVDTALERPLFTLDAEVNDRLRAFLERFSASRANLTRVHTLTCPADLNEKMPFSAYALYGPPRAEEKYLVALFDQALYERGMLRSEFIAAIRTVGEGISVPFQFHAAVAVIMRAASLIGTSLPYAYDVEVTEAGRVTPKEDASDDRVTGIPDCEDSAKEAINMIYWELERGGPFGDELLQSAQSALQYYVPTLELYAVSSAAVNEQSTGGVMAHIGPALIPRKFFIEHTIACEVNVATEEWEDDLFPIFGEGTGLMEEIQQPFFTLCASSEYVTAQHKALRAKIDLIKKHGVKLDIVAPANYPFSKDVRSVLRETNGPFNAFKKHVISLFSPKTYYEWGLGVSKWGCVRQKHSTYGVPFSAWALAPYLAEGEIGLAAIDRWSAKEQDVLAKIIEGQEPLRTLLPGQRLGAPPELVEALRKAATVKIGTGGTVVDFIILPHDDMKKVISGINTAASLPNVIGVEYKLTQLTRSRIGTTEGLWRGCVKIHIT